MNLPSPSDCPWIRQCLIDFGTGTMPGYVGRDQYGDRAYFDLETLFCGKGPCREALKMTYEGGADFYRALANDLTMASVPIPAGALLLLTALAALAAWRRS
ncbi:VPLPA-CTERM sorting domain-containing protein [Paracoccus sp. 22332]|uniref:VPLPA-CTERM sorting domain-containing protein n=1 Tax=Paracoccus sp. 22332 TaxID=3453913 RepID=UPI003F828D0A